MFDYLETTVNVSEQCLTVGDFNIPAFVDYVINNNHSDVCIALSNFMQYHSLKQFNDVKNTNSKILDLVVSTKDIACSVSRCESPLVNEAGHHPSLLIQISLRDVTSCLFDSNDDSYTYNFSKADFLGLYRAVSEVN